MFCVPLGISTIQDKILLTSNVIKKKPKNCNLESYYAEVQTRIAGEIFLEFPLRN